MAKINTLYLVEFNKQEQALVPNELIRAIYSTEDLYRVLDVLQYSPDGESYPDSKNRERLFYRVKNVLPERFKL